MITGSQPLFYTDIRKSVLTSGYASEGEGVAYFTHYLHNRECGVSGHFKEQAEVFLHQASRGLFQNIKVLNDIKAIHWDIPFPAQEFPEFTFIDLFAGLDEH